MVSYIFMYDFMYEPNHGKFHSYMTTCMFLHDHLCMYMQSCMVMNNKFFRIV